MNDICKIPLQHNGLTEQQLDAMDQLEAIHAYQEKQCKCHRARAWQKIVGVKSIMIRIKEKMFKIGK